MREEVFALPWPPSANNSKLPGKRGMVSTKALRSYHTLATLTIRSLQIAPVPPPYEVVLTFHPKDNRRRDIANFEKAPVDAMVKAGLLEDDCLIHKLTLIRGEKFRNPMVVVEIYQIPKEDGDV